MIDTVVLMMDSNQFKIENHYMFSPNTRSVFHFPHLVDFGKEKRLKFINNPTAQQKKDGYWPRLTLQVTPARHAGGLCKTLRVEFSVPKMLFGNNFSEISNTQFGEMVDNLIAKMKQMGVVTTPEDIGQSLLSSVHYSKNILLTEHTRCSMVLQELSKINIWKRLDINSKDYRNQGHVLKWHANSYEICVYDKVKDLKQSKISPKRAFEAEAASQFNLFNEKPELQVLRLEIRLNTRRKIKSILKAIGEREDVSFVELCSYRVARKVLNYFWSELMANNSTAALLELDMKKPEQLAESIQKAHPNLKPSKIASLIGTIALVQSIGEKGLNPLFGTNNPRTIKRLLDEAKSYQPTSNPRWVAIHQVKEQLQQFQPLRLESMV